MNHTKKKATSGLKSFNTFNTRFFHACYVLRGVLGVQLLLVLTGGVLFSFCEEGISAWDGIYFALITATSVGYGDITPDTVIGQAIGVCLALIGTVFFGLVVATATRAVTVTVAEYQQAKGDSFFDPIETTPG